MSKATYEGFVEFVKSQPTEQRIRHYSWETCSVGEYYRSIGELPPTSMLPENNPDTFATTNLPLFEQLNKGYEAEKIYPTYGDLAAAL